MHLTQYSGLGLRVLIYVGLQRERLSTIAEIADAYDISKNHLMKVVQQLAAEGFLHSRRGRNGGIRLAGAPEDLTIGGVVRRLEPNLAVAACMRAGQDCPLMPVCRLRGKLQEASNAFLGVLDEVTLADVLADGNHQETLRDLLGLERDGSFGPRAAAAGSRPCGLQNGAGSVG